MTSRTTSKFSPEVHARAVRMVLLEPIGNIAPADAEERYYAAADIVDMAA